MMMITWSADCCSIRTVSAEVIQPEQARQSARVIVAFSSFLTPPPAVSWKPLLHCYMSPAIGFYFDWFTSK